MVKSRRGIKQSEQVLAYAMAEPSVVTRPSSSEEKQAELTPLIEQEDPRDATDILEALQVTADMHDISNDPVARDEPELAVKVEDFSADTTISAPLDEADLALYEIAATQPGAKRELQGRIERATSTMIAGWAWDPQTPDDSIRLELLDGEKRVSMTIADTYRRELVELGCGDGRHGFDIRLQDGLLLEGRHVLTLRCSETGATMPGPPIVFERRNETAPSSGREAIAEQRAIRYNIDKVTTSGGIQGWIMSPDQPSHRSVVALMEGSRILARAVASEFRLDLLTAGVGDGCYSFEFIPPHSLLDGREHLLDLVEEDSGIHMTPTPLRWGSGSGAGPKMSPRLLNADMEPEPLPAKADLGGYRHTPFDPMRSDGSRGVNFSSAAHAGIRILFDISDLVYYIGHHSNLTGIQRVQSSIVLSMVDAKEFSPGSMIFLSFNAATRDWAAIPAGFLISLLRSLFLPDQQRLVKFSAEAARYGALPGAQAFDGTGVLDDGNPSVLCLLGAAWVHQDYLHRVLSLKRRFGTRFVMTIHDLIPIYARDTCDQDTTRVFEEFMRRTLPHVDHILTVSESTAKDVRRYLGTLQLSEPPITVTRNGSSFAEFLPKGPRTGVATLRDLPERFVLFVGTIEGRKNHQLIFDIWRRMVDAGDDPPHLICVGRLGWKAAAFVSVLVETNYLDGTIHLMREIPDTDLQLLYARCLFTVCPSFYEGWGLPVGESLAMGKICVCSDRASIPEVAGDCGVYIDIDDVGQSLEVIRELIADDSARAELEAKIQREYVPITWHSVAQRVAAACHGAPDIQWQEPYPYATVPYSTEISFGRLDPDIDGKGELLLSRIIDARLGHFRFDPVDQRGFVLGEEIRSTGVWAQPEPWGSWLCHSGGDIVFDLAAEASQFYFVSVRVRVCGALHEEPIALLANGNKLWEGEIGLHSKDIMIRVAKRRNGTGRWRLRIGAELEVSPEVKRRLAVIDGRIPTIGFERMIVVPERDTVTRLDMMTKSLL
jgi:glycosyltransferase involved in cell wall biosynthesis